MTIHKLVLMAAVCVFGVLTASSNHALNLRIVGGYETQLNQYPSIAALEYTEDGVASFICAGTLVAPQWVLTAAHCLSRVSDVNLLNVTLNTSNLSDRARAETI